MIMERNEIFVTPGEKVATEEEFAAGNNTFAEDGVIYSSVIGNVTKEGGTVSVSASGREIKIIDKNMLVLGIVTDDIKSVIFVKIDDINVDSKDYLALKDGKIVMEKPRPQRYGGGDRGGGGNRFGSTERQMRPCGTGDTILARVLYNDKDSYTLSLDENETGVIYAKCTVCGGDMAKEQNALVCKECGHKEFRKISEYYGKPEEIKKLFV
jgi:exosome complex component CSL4